MIRSGFASGIGRIRRVWRALVKCRVLGFERTIHFIRRNMMKTMVIDHALRQPHLARCLQHRVRTKDVRLDECVRTVNRSIHVRLRREVHDRIDALFTQQTLNQRAVANVAMDESEFRLTLCGFQVCKIARVSQCIEYNESLRGY